MLKRIFARWDKKPGFLSRMAYRIEGASKLAMYGCQDCGDCSLPDFAYLCPKKWLLEVRAQRALRRLGRRPLRVGRQGCFWARVYERLKYYGESEEMFEGPVTIYNASLKETSSWANTFLDRDHNAKRD